LEHARCEALLLAEQAEQDVFGTDVVVLERPRLVLGENDDLAGSFGEAFEHCASSFPRGPRGMAEAPIVANGSGDAAPPNGAFDSRNPLPANRVESAQEDGSKTAFTPAVRRRLPAAGDARDAG